jgi:hypothetical protein
VTRSTPLVLIVLVLAFGTVRAQTSTEQIVRTPPPPRDDLEVDANEDGVPDGWYNARDVVIETKGGASGPHFLRFECPRRGRPARLSRAFGVDGRKTQAIILGLWVRQTKIQHGERQGEEPGMMIDFVGNQMRYLRHVAIGPWAHAIGPSWTRVVKRIAIPPSSRDTIISVGLMGATGTMDIDGLSVELIPLGDRFNQIVHLVIKKDGKLIDKELKPTLFVPMTGKALSETAEPKPKPQPKAEANN